MTVQASNSSFNVSIKYRNSAVYVYDVKEATLES